MVDRNVLSWALVEMTLETGTDIVVKGRGLVELGSEFGAPENQV